MKLSLAWIFDHLIGSWNDYNVHEIVKQCSLKTAEIEHAQHITIDLTLFTLVRVNDIKENSISAFSSEWNKELTLPLRTDGQIGQYYVIKKLNNMFLWATLNDWASSKDGLIPAIFLDDMAVMGSWKDAFEAEDYILEVSNVTITNRPDLWCHRGFAREISALFDIPLKPQELMLAQATVKPSESFAAGHTANPFSLENKEPAICKRFAGLYFSSVVSRPSPLLMAHRLAKVDCRPINVIVDATNYVMYDLSQPLHAFDAQKLQGNKLIQRIAHKGEKLTLLDGETIELSSEDIVVADGKRPVGLAGIMGGAETGISSNTSAVLVEAANYHAAAIRKSSTRHKIRTEASARFEKSLDPNQNVTGLLRFLKLLEEIKIPFETQYEIQSLGHEAQTKQICVDHAYIESALGVNLKPEYVVKTLETLEFAVEQNVVDAKLAYTIAIPTFRGTKDITIKQDIVEEIGRFYGYTNIPAVLPAMQLNVSDLSRVIRMGAIKQNLAFATHAHEVNNYPCFDEQFLHTLKWEPVDYVAIKNPVSEYSRRLVTSLVPHLFKNITHNPKETFLRFFEMNTTWHKHKNRVEETLNLAGIMYQKQGQLSFYDGKQYLETLFRLLKFDVIWHKPESIITPWFHPYQTAVLMFHDKLLGYAGKVAPGFFANVAEGDAFIFELNANLLLTLKPEEKLFELLAKYPETSMDVSMLVPLQVTLQQILQTIKDTHTKIISVELLDIFQKEEWLNQKSVTIRFVARDPEKTLEKADIEAIYTDVLFALKALGATIR